MRLLGMRSNKELACATGVAEPVISRWRNARATPSVAQLRLLAGPLQTPLLGLLVVVGYLDESEAREEPSTDPVADRVIQAIRSDSELTPEMQEFAVQQYSIARVLSARVRGRETTSTDGAA